MTEYNPDSWVVIKMTTKNETFYKVLGGWSGGYLNGDSWRLNSGVEKIERVEDKLHFYGASGSVYICDPKSYGLRMSTFHVWETMKKTYPDNVELLEDQNWEEFLQNAV